MGCPIILGEKKKALLLKLVDGLVLDLDNAFILLSQAVSAEKTIRGEGKKEEKHRFQ